jgi:hypothetical protein
VVAHMVFVADENCVSASTKCRHSRTDATTPELIVSDFLISRTYWAIVAGLKFLEPLATGGFCGRLS